MPYDALGNYVPGDEPTVDEMRLALSKANPSGRRQETEAEYRARMVNQLPPAFGVDEYRPPYVEPKVPESTATSTLGQVLDRSGITAIPQVAAAVLSSYPSAIAKEMGYDKAAQKIQYEPTSRYANEMLQGLGHAMEVAKVPPYVAHIPMARPYMTPNDVRVLGAQVAKTGREIRDIPADFVNAQSGLKRQDIFGQPTLGTRLQGTAENIGDLMARREMQGLSAVPGIPASIVPETKMYAVRPAGYGQIIEQSDLPGKPGEYASGNLSTVRDIIEDIRPPVEGGNVGHKLATYERNFFSPVDGLRETMRQLEFAKIREMYPDAPTEADAIDAYRRTRSDQEQVQDKLKWYDESIKDPRIQELVDQHNFERQLIVNELNDAKMQKKSGLPPEQKREIDDRVRQLEQDLQRIPEINLPSMAEYERRIKAADRYLNTEFKNEIKKYIGSSEGAMMNLAKKGITFKPAEEIMYSAEDLKRDIARSGATGNRQTVEQALEEARTKAGFNPKGETFPMVEVAQTKFDDAQNKLNELNSEKFALREQHLLENPDIPDPAQNPGPLGERYRALTNKIESAASARDKSKKELDNFRLANAYELLSDYAYVPMTAGELKNRLQYAERATAFPNLAKTPDEAQMFNVRETMINDAMGLKDAADRYAEAIVRGEIKLDKNDRPTKSLDKYIEETTELRRKKEDYERALESRKTELLDEYAKSTVRNIPSDLKFGNASALELTKDTPFADVRRQISFDGSVFDHCVAAADAPHPGTNPYTGQRYSYSFPVDPATGIERTSKSSSYMEGVKNGEKMITSLRDNTTGLPAATIEFKNRKEDGTYKIGYVSAHKNDPVSAEYRNDLRDYLNKRSNIIRDVDNGMAALYKSGVYDTARTESQLMSYGLSRQDVALLQNTEHPRFITTEDMAKLRTAPDEGRNALVQERDRIREELEEAQDRLERWQQNDPDDVDTHQHIQGMIDDYRHQIMDLDQRIDSLPVRNAPARVNMDVAGRRFDAIASAISNGSSMVSAELQSLARRHPIASQEFGVSLAQRVESIPAELADFRREMSTALDNWRSAGGNLLPSNEQLIQRLTENQLRDVNRTFQYMLDGERFADDYNWDHEGQMRTINGIRNGGDLNLGPLVSEEIRMINNMTPNQREMLARNLEDNFILNMDMSTQGGVVSLADFEGELPGISQFYHDARARARGELPNPMPDILADTQPTNLLERRYELNRELQNADTNETATRIQNEINDIDERLRANPPQNMPQPSLRALTDERDRLREMLRQISTQIVNATDEGDRISFIRQRNDIERSIAQNRDNIERAERAEGQPVAQIQAEDNLGDAMVLQAAQNNNFSTLEPHLSDLARREVSNVAQYVGGNLEETANYIEGRINQILDGSLYGHLMPDQRQQLANALSNFENEISRAPVQANPADAWPAPARRAEPVITDLNQTLQESLESARGLHTGRDMNAATDALDDISRNIDLTDDPTDFIAQLRGRADNSRDGVSAILNNIADDLEGAMEAPAPERRVRRVTGEPGTINRVVNDAVAQYANENTGSAQSVRQIMRELEGQTREQVRDELLHIIAQTSNERISDVVMDRYGVDSPGGLRQLSQALNYIHDNLPTNFASGGLVQRFKNGGGAENTDDAGYSDSLKMWGDTATRIAPEGSVRGAGDAARHIIASADIARRYGRIPAAIAGYGHEFLNLIQGDQTVDDLIQDVRNNSLGRDIGANSKSYQDIVNATKEALSGVKPYEKIPGKAYIMETGKSMKSYKNGGEVTIDEMRLELMRNK